MLSIIHRIETFETIPDIRCNGSRRMPVKERINVKSSPLRRILTESATFEEGHTESKYRHEGGETSRIASNKTNFFLNREVFKKIRE
jgi:hypothetical protein